MASSVRQLAWKLFRRRLTIDPSRHFAVRVRGKYARPITREHFNAVIGDFEKRAAILERIAVLGRQQLSGLRDVGALSEGARSNLRKAVDEATDIKARFDDFVDPMIFSDHVGHKSVNQTRNALNAAMSRVNEALSMVEAGRAEPSASTTRKLHSCEYTDENGSQQRVPQVGEAAKGR